MDINVKMKCGSDSLKENKSLLKYIIETGVLNSQKKFAKEIMNEFDKYDLEIGSTILEKIKEDKELYYGYQSNIAMAFKDEYYRYKKNKGKNLNSNDIHTIANNAAKQFLNLLLKVGE